MGASMKIHVRGFGKEHQQNIKDSVRFFADQLMSSRLTKNMVIEVIHKPNLSVMAEVGAKDDGRYPKHFKIDIRAANGDDPIVQTLAHEMVHVKQYAKNQLSTRLQRVAKGKGHHYEYVMKWYNKVWEPGKKEDEYWDSPWELEAYGKEPGLYHKWLNT